MTQPENPMPMRPYRLLFSVADRDGNPVRLDEAQWVGHVLSRHPEMEFRLEEIQSVIRSPEIVRLGDYGEYRLASQGAVAGLPQLYLRVVVNYFDEISGRRLGSVRTAHMSKTPPTGEEVI